MTGISLEIRVRDVMGDRIESLVAGLKNRAPMHRYILAQALPLTRDWLLDLARTRHQTAQLLGASPTGHWAQAAEKTRGKATADSARVSVRQVGISRVERDIVIKPGPGKKFVTIAAIAQAYGQRAYRVPGLVAIVRGDHGVLMKPGPGKSHTYKSRIYSGPRRSRAAKVQGGPIGTVWYTLVKQVRQRRDRSLLPSDEAYRLAALKGLRLYVQQELVSRASTKGGGQ